MNTISNADGNASAEGSVDRRSADPDWQRLRISIGQEDERGSARLLGSLHALVIHPGGPFDAGECLGMLSILSGASSSATSPGPSTPAPNVDDPPSPPARTLVEGLLREIAAAIDAREASFPHADQPEALVDYAEAFVQTLDEAGPWREGDRWVEDVVEPLVRLARHRAEDVVSDGAAVDEVLEQYGPDFVRHSVFDLARVFGDRRGEVWDDVEETIVGRATPPHRPADRRADRIDRHRPCPCGSGRRYVDCCGD